MNNIVNLISKAINYAYDKKEQFSITIDNGTETVRYNEDVLKLFKSFLGNCKGDAASKLSLINKTLVLFTPDTDYVVVLTYNLKTSPTLSGLPSMECYCYPCAPIENNQDTYVIDGLEDEYSIATVRFIPHAVLPVCETGRVSLFTLAGDKKAVNSNEVLSNIKTISRIMNGESSLPTPTTVVNNYDWEDKDGCDTIIDKNAEKALSIFEGQGPNDVNEINNIMDNNKRSEFACPDVELLSVDKEGTRYYRLFAHQIELRDLQVKGEVNTGESELIYTVARFSANTDKLHVICTR